MKCPYCNKLTANEAKLCVHCGKDVQNSFSRETNKSIKCPICHVPTSIITLANIDLDFCFECSGIWFDKREMKQFQKNIAQENISDNISSVLNEIVSEKAKHQRGIYINCPICNELMIHKNYHELSGIILDQCLDHGTWAEKQDLVKIFDLISTGDIEQLKEKASKRRYQNLEKKINALDSEQISMKANIARNERFSKTHFLLDFFGFL